MRNVSGRPLSAAVLTIVVAGAAGAVAFGGALSACGSNDDTKSEFDGGGTSTSDRDATTGDGGTGGGGNDNDAMTIHIGDVDGSQTACAGLQCAISANCTGDAASTGTTITGRVLDPAGVNPIYNVVVYVPMYDPADPASIPDGGGGAIEPISGGINFPDGVSCDSCSYLFTGNPVAVGVTQPDGTFVIPNAPSGSSIPLVVQIGKWRTHTSVKAVPSCGTASAGDIQLPSSADGSDPIVSMPQFALSMGNSDSLECLLYRIGINLSEFTPGAGSSGHVHLFTGVGMTSQDGGAPPAPEGASNLWDSLADLEKYDVSLFSCEGRETTDANPQILEQYVNAGGRAFTSHYHYSWLSGPLEAAGNGHGPVSGTYQPNADWSELATWNHADPGVVQQPWFGATQTDLIGVKISQTLNGGGDFPKGIALNSWLTAANAFGGDVASDEVAIQAPAFDPDVVQANPDSQPWATYDPASYVTQTDRDAGDSARYPTAYFSFNTPINAVAPPDGGAAPYCGRVVFSGLHVSGAAQDTTTDPENYKVSLPSTTTCNPSPGNLSPQEKILEFMLFDLSSCVSPDTAAPTIPITLPR